MLKKLAPRKGGREPKGKGRKSGERAEMETFEGGEAWGKAQGGASSFGPLFRPSEALIVDHLGADI